MISEEDAKLAIRLLHVWHAWSLAQNVPAQQDPLYPGKWDAGRDKMRAEVETLMKRYPYESVKPPAT